MQARVLIGLGAAGALLFGACAGGDALGGADGGATRDIARVTRDLSGGGSDEAARSSDRFDAGTTSAIGYDQEVAAVPRALGDDGSSLPQTEPIPPSASGVGPSIIKTATVRLSIEGDFSRAVHEATTVAERYGGYVVSTTLDDEGKGFAAATLRIPADKFGAAMGAVRGVGTVEREEISGEDVTQQVIDLEARLRNLRAQEAVLLRLMDDAGSVLETIRIQEHLSDVQLEIERLRGRLRYLDDQVSFSTIFVEMRRAGEGPAPKVGVLGRAWHRAVDGALSVVGGTIVAIGFAFPLAIILLLAGLALRLLWPRLRKVPSIG